MSWDSDVLRKPSHVSYINVGRNAQKTMRHLIIVLVVSVLGQSCSTQGTKETVLDSVSDPVTISDKENFESKDEVFFKQYTDDKGHHITEQQKVTFDTGSGKAKKYTLVVSRLNSKFIGGTEQAINKLNVKAYIDKDSRFDELIWEINKEEEEPVGAWGDYYKTVVHGCCGAEDSYTYYDIDTGKEFLKFSELKRTVSPYYLNYGFLSLNSMGFTDPGDKTIIGYFYHIKENLKTNTDDLTTYSVHSKKEDGEIAFTPEMSLENKRWLKETGFFKNYPLFQNGDTLKTLDTANYYIIFKYYDIGRSILLPLDKEGLRDTEYFSNDKELSQDWMLKRK